jgi:hypothetical protein
MPAPTTLARSLAHTKTTLARPSRIYEAARPRHRALAPYETPASLLSALTRSAPPLDVLERDALIAALVTENQRAPQPIWQSLLLVAFERMLFRLRRRLGGRRDDEDLDQRVLLAFLNALRSVRVSSYVALGIRWAAEGEVFASRRAELRAPEIKLFDDDTYLGDPFGVDAHARASAEEVVRIVEAEGGEELLRVLLATRAGDESLTKYVAREYADRTQAERAAAYDRLQIARSRIVDEVRARLAPRTASSAA